MVLGGLVQELYWSSLLGAGVPLLLLLHCHVVNDLGEIHTRVLELWGVGSSCWHLLSTWLLLVLLVSLAHWLAQVCFVRDVVLHGHGREHWPWWWRLPLHGLLVLDEDAAVSLLVTCKKGNG
jgi:hypothetical protein